MYSSFVMNLVALHAGPTFPTLWTLIASTSTAPLTPPKDTQRERVHLARFVILLDCMYTPNDVCPAPAVLPARLAWRVAVERDKHMGLKMSKCGFSPLNLFSALTWSARCPSSRPKRRSIATPALNPKAPARCRLVDEYVSTSATAPRPPA